MSLRHYLINCTDTNIICGGQTLCQFCFSWANSIAYLSRSSGNSQFRLTYNDNDFAKNLITREKGREEKSLRSIENGYTTLMYAIKFLSPYWCAFLIVVCEVDIFARNLEGNNAIELAEKFKEDKKLNEDLLFTLDCIIFFLRDCVKTETIYPSFALRELTSIGFCKNIAALIFSYTPRAPRLWPYWVTIDLARGY